VKNEYPDIVSMPSDIVPFFFTSFMREAAPFSTLKTMKSRNRSTLRDVHREMRVTMSAFRPRIELYGDYTSLLSPTDEIHSKYEYIH
jgi:hypothetical protein